MVGTVSFRCRLIRFEDFKEMEKTPVIDLEIDFRDYAESPKTPRDFISFWNSFAPLLVGRNLESGVTREIERKPQGTFRISVMSAIHGSVLITENTRFAIRSILEKSRTKRFCAECRRSGQNQFGIYSCPTCYQANQEDWLCDSHAVILHGGMALDKPPRANCQDHAPLCSCRQKAVYWCQGPNCRRKVAWCSQHCKQHPNDAGIFYCPKCYEKFFPACYNEMCKNTATGICEYITIDGKSCERRLCSRHISRWQIYGPHKIGLGLCQEHCRIKNLQDSQIIYQIVAATATRKMNEPRAFHDLPSLQSVKHIFLKARSRNYGLEAVNQMFVDIIARTGNQSPLQSSMMKLLDKHKQFRQQNIIRDQQEKQQGLQIFEQLKQLLYQMEQNEIAEKIVFSDYRPKNEKIISDSGPKVGTLYIRLPDDLRGRLIGKGGSNIKQIEIRLNGVSVKFEK